MLLNNVCIYSILVLLKHYDNDEKMLIGVANVSCRDKCGRKTSKFSLPYFHT